MVKYIVAISGASGSVYGIRLIRELLIREQEVHIIVSEPARLVIKHELGWDLSGSLEGVLRSKLPSGHMYFYDNQNIAAPLASGSFISRAMIVMPCSMACLSGIATGNARNLIERAADVMLKERRKLILVPRETPLHSVHLRNMLKTFHNTSETFCTSTSSSTTTMNLANIICPIPHKELMIFLACPGKLFFMEMNTQL